MRRARCLRCRNTVRETISVRFSEAERRQVAAAAERSGQAVSSFVRDAALAASARVTGKVSEAERRDGDEAASVYADRGLVGLERPKHYVDGEWTGGYLP
jgi:uncharacterized protein (DUF1778 family)